MDRQDMLIIQHSSHDLIIEIIAPDHSNLFDKGFNI